MAEEESPEESHSVRKNRTQSGKTALACGVIRLRVGILPVLFLHGKQFRE